MADIRDDADVLLANVEKIMKEHRVKTEDFAAVLEEIAGCIPEIGSENMVIFEALYARRVMEVCIQGLPENDEDVMNMLRAMMQTVHRTYLSDLGRKPLIGGSIPTMDDDYSMVQAQPWVTPFYESVHDVRGRLSKILELQQREPGRVIFDFGRKLIKRHEICVFPCIAVDGKKICDAIEYLIETISEVSDEEY